MGNCDFDVLRVAAARHPGDILAPYDEIYAAAGFDGLAAMLGHLGGCYVYVPQLRFVLAKCIELEAVAAFRAHKGMSVPSVARLYGYSEGSLRRILRPYKGK